MESAPKILVIIPAYNEAPSIARVIDEIRASIPEADVVVINDASGDSTALVAKTKGVDVVSHVCNLGIGGAVQTGFRYAWEKEYDMAIQVDADGQHNPEDIPKLLMPIVNQEADVVIGSRYLEDRKYKTSFARRAGILLFSQFISATIHQRITDTTSGFRAINKRVIEFFSKEYPVDFPDAEALLLLGLLDFKIKEIPTTMRKRASGTSSTSILKEIYYPFKVSLSILATLLREKPLLRKEE